MRKMCAKDKLKMRNNIDYKKNSDINNTKSLIVI